MRQWLVLCSTKTCDENNSHTMCFINSVYLKCIVLAVIFCCMLGPSFICGCAPYRILKKCFEYKNGKSS